jgi:hypothetical protein
MKAFLLLIIIALQACGANGHGWNSQHTPEPPTDSDLAELRARVDAAASALRDLPVAHRQQLEAAVAQAATSLRRLEDLSRKGARRKKATGLLYMAGVATIANDPTGIGLADNVLLPFIGLGILATYLAMEAPAPPRELTQAWEEVIGRLDAVGKAAEAIRAERLPDVPRSDCIANYVRCQESGLSRIKYSGQSQCHICLDACKRVGAWPDSWAGGTMDCRWWMHP